jgi:Legume lectin domain
MLPFGLALLACAALLQETAPKLNVHLVGTAKVLTDRIRLTPAQRQTVGAAWFAPKQRVADGFEAVFEFQITHPGGLGPGADGFAFVLQNQGLNALGGLGSAGGFALGDRGQDPSKAGIPHSIAVFFDTYRNTEVNDPSDNYIAICTNGPVSDMRWPPRRLGLARKLRVHLKDGKVHSAGVRYRPPIMTVALDGGAPVISVPVDLATVVDHSGSAFVGFTASTGNGYENHDILTWAFTPDEPSTSTNMFVVQSDIHFLPTNCLPGRNLCTPAEAVVQESGDGSYHVVLPANLEWGASIPNPNGRAVAISHAVGSVCWARTADGEYECSGPDPGSLLSKTENGRTWFSVNGRKGRGFASNQGFFEFDVRLN